MLLNGRRRVTRYSRTCGYSNNNNNNNNYCDWAVTVVLTLVQTKQIRMNIHKRNNTKTQYKEKIQVRVHIIPKHLHNCQNTRTLQNPHTHTQPHIKKPTHTYTHTLQNPYIHTPTHYKTHTYTHPHIIKRTYTHTFYKTRQVKVTTVQDTQQMK